MNRKLARSAFVAAVAAGLAVTTTSAHASDMDSWSLELRAHAHFEDYGEIVTIEDTAKDGRSAVVQVRYSGTEYKTYWNPNGVNSVRTINLSIPEMDEVWIRACSGEYSGYRIYVEECGYWKGGRA
ncbi:hypothetical protein [Streptomyces sp. UG1]|uniref:hypothetical protein n=1 Tax=Streptomyces sp. UG1 TaxID=3417652 RepID=UPI003CF047D6